MRDVDFFLDTFCPFAWNASRFVIEAAGPTGTTVNWRFISLAVLNEGSGQNGLDLAARSLRVAAAARDHGGNDAVGDYYTAVGTLLHPGGASMRVWRGEHLDVRDLVEEALRTAGLPAHLAHAAEEPAFDEVVRAETDEALRRTGPDVGTPIITFDLQRPTETSLFGPVISAIPRGEDAVRLWEALLVVADSGVSELKRSNRGELRFD